MSHTTLIDEILPRYDFREIHSASIQAPSNIILDCIARMKMADDPMVRLAITLRELPTRLIGGSSRKPLDFDDFTPLARDGNSSLAVGLIGAFWQADYGLLAVDSLEMFTANDNKNVCRLVIGFATAAHSSGKTILTTETRVFCPTSTVKRKFAPYWYVIRPVSGLIRKRMLSRIRRQAESIVGMA